MDWKDEFIWVLISLISGLSLSFLFYYFDRFPNVSYFNLSVICFVAYYILSIIVRVQNQRMKLLTLGKNAFNEKYLKIVFPVMGLAIGCAVLFF
jgi:hypothetical protein